MVKLPKLDVPTFSGNILQWLTFWEQFSVAIHDGMDVTKPQKMAYLCQALKHGSVRNMVEGLSRTGEQYDEAIGEQYDEAIECLENRYNKPRLIHQAHVKEIKFPVSGTTAPRKSDAFMMCCNSTYVLSKP